MTICIAALCEKGKTLVVASDRMVSGGDVEFEQDTQKIDQLAGHCVALTAGSALEHVDLLRSCSMTVQDRTAPRIYDIAEVVKKSFVELRQKRAEEQFFHPIGLDIQTFLQTQTRLSPDIVLRLTKTLEVAELDLEMIVAGVDYSGGHIYLINDPGYAQCIDAIGFCCIGSGEHHATMTFIRSAYSIQTPLHQAIYLTYQAKRDAEVAPGVGENFTDLAYIKDDRINFINDSMLKELAKIYDKTNTEFKLTMTKVDDELRKLFDSTGDNDADKNQKE